jgi:hypothetical protein
MKTVGRHASTNKTKRADLAVGSKGDHLLMSIIHFRAIYNGKSVYAGSLRDDGVFRKKVKTRSKLFKNDAYGLDKRSMDDVIGFGAKRLELTVVDGGIIYEIDIETFNKHAVVDKVGKVGKVVRRYYCPLVHWDSRPYTPKGKK